MTRSIYSCTACHLRPDGKLSNVTIASRWDGTSRVAYRLRLCLTCYCTKVLGIQPPDDAEVLVCPCCGIDVEGIMRPVFVTAYLPGVGRTEIQSPMCDPCNLTYREFAMLGEHLPDTMLRGQDPGPSTIPAGTEGWAAIGLYPRE